MVSDEKMIRELGRTTTARIAVAISSGLLLHVFAATSISADGYSFTPLGLLPDTINSRADAVSADGSVVVGISWSNLRQEPFRWTRAGGMVGLGFLPGADVPAGFANGVSSDGSVIVGASRSASVGETGFEGFRWTAASGMVSVGDLSGGSFRSPANAVSADGSVVVGQSESSSGSEGFRWTSASGIIGLGDLAGGFFSSSANGVSADGSIIVGLGRSASGTEAFRWTIAGGMVGL
jgi:probable HAF family extracellular repeat protein